MKTHKRKKNSRIRGARTCGWGFRQKHKGHGNKGGFGMAGAGKRADHKKQFAKNLDKNKVYFGKQGLTSRGTAIKKYDAINLKDIKANFFDGKQKTIELKGYKILGEGEGFKAEIKAKSATASAIEKMQKAGGKITFETKEKIVKEETKKKTENKEKITEKKINNKVVKKKPSVKKK
ncbi:MAG: uL15 family ribosomal protein [Candidatus Pacearchaeota archaeon]